jgi:hypothetical protein
LKENLKGYNSNSYERIMNERKLMLVVNVARLNELPIVLVLFAYASYRGEVAETKIIYYPAINKWRHGSRNHSGNFETFKYWIKARVAEFKRYG